ncbi:MAG: hypothetical protein PHX83_16700 [Acidobacteriia bacterium]|nr:hypothetical protein [Terriglobia bacterium]
MRKNLVFALLVLCLVIVVGCSQAPQSGAAANASDNNAATATATRPEPPKPLVLPENTPVSVRLIDSLNSAENHSGDTFRASLDEDLTAEGKVVFPRNSTVTGRVTSAVPSGHLKTPAEIAVTLTSIQAPNGQEVALETNSVGEKAKSHKTRNAEMIGGGAGVGALVGALAGKGKGAAIGAGVGAGAGTAVAYGTGKKDIGYASETRLTFRLRNPVTVAR